MACGHIKKFIALLNGISSFFPTMNCYSIVIFIISLNFMSCEECFVSQSVCIEFVPLNLRISLFFFIGLISVSLSCLYAYKFITLS